MKILKPGTKVLLDNIKLGQDTRTGCYMPHSMNRLQGKVVTIREHLHTTDSASRYDIEECHFTYTDEMFSIVVPKNIIGGKLL